MPQKSLLMIAFIVISFTHIQAQKFYKVETVKTLAGVKKMYLESLIFEENPQKLKHYKKTIYYKKMMKAKTSDSVYYYYKQFIETDGIKKTSHS